MQRSLWRGAISFGLIYVPVELHSASKENSLSLHLLDSRDFAPVGYHRVNKRTGKEVDWSHIVKGYEYRKGEYVALSDADFKHANVRASETIDIANFAAAADIPAMYYEHPYYLTPAKGGNKVYTLLRKALLATHKVALATFVMRGRQHLCALCPSEEALMLITLRFADEVSAPAAAKNAAASKATVTAAELAMAQKLIAEMSSSFNLATFKDTYRADLMRRIQEKIKRKQTHALMTDEEVPAPKQSAQVIDLMQALKDSLKRKGATGARVAPRKSSHRGALKPRRRAS